MIFDIGDTVQLRSGGPEMTVITVPIEQKQMPLIGSLSPVPMEYGCVWFAEDHQASAIRDRFPANALELVNQRVEEE